MKRVLAIGLDPLRTNLSAYPEVDPAVMMAYIKQQIAGIRELDLEVVDCLITPDDEGIQEAETALQSSHFDCIMIGAGLREPPELLHLFEQIINAVHKLAPDAAICFNTSPADSVEAVQRWISP